MSSSNVSPTPTLQPETTLQIRVEHLLQCIQALSALEQTGCALSFLDILHEQRERACGQYPMTVVHITKTDILATLARRNGESITESPPCCDKKQKLLYPDCALSLGNLLLAVGWKREAHTIFRVGLLFDPSHASLFAALRGMGERRRPVFAWLPRRCHLNRLLGLLRFRALRLLAKGA